MRPLYLFIQGFGPYLKVEIDEDCFQLIQRERLFLISGEIGAGKTTLFDGILFALFGEASFPDRTPKDLISHLLLRHPQITPEVTFKFLYQGKVYKISRRPPYDKHAASVSLWINDKIYSQKAGEVSEKIRDLFGLDGKQFKKVFMIPQGEYREILLSDPKERKALFERLFDTETFSRLEEFFKDQAKALRDKLSLLRERELEILKLAEVVTFEDLEEKIKGLSDKKESLQRELKTLSQSLKNLDESIRKKEWDLEMVKKGLSLVAELKALEERVPEVENLKKRVERLKALKERAAYFELVERNKSLIRERIFALKKEEASIKVLESSLKETSEKLKVLSEKEESMKAKKETLIKKQEALSSLQRAKELERTFTELDGIFQSTGKALEQTNSSAETLQRELELTQREKEDLKTLLELSKNLEEKRVMLSKIRAYKTKRETLDELLERIRNLETKRNARKEELEHLKTRHLAITLAQALKEGEPCPVCGSRVHPAKAQRDLFLTQIEPLQKALEDLESELEKAKKAASKLEGEISLLEDLVKDNEETLEVEILSLESSLADLSRKDFRFKEPSGYERREKELRTRLEELERQKRTLQMRFLEISEKKASVEGELKALKGFLKDSLDEKLLYEEIKNLSEEISFYEKTFEGLKESLLSLERALHTHKANRESLLREIADRQRELKSSVKEIALLIKQGLFKDLSEMKLNFEELKNLAHYEERIFTFERDLHRIGKTLRELRDEARKKEIRIDEETFSQLSEELRILHQERSKLEREKEQRERELGKMEELLHQSENLKRAYREVLAEKKDLEEEFPYLEKLSLLLSGKTTGISFHSFVLSRFLSLILKSANNYLSDFTFGRYRFVEGEVFTKRFILEVFDHYTGTKREIKTLSGGESFLAALAFALGASDILLTLSKKGPLEILLIDEGFGSLDVGTLDRVVQGLLKLSQKTGKIIGVISHLRDLNEHFPLVLEVIKNPEKGSSLKVRRNL
jgi:exonuclease SbcC